MPPRGVKGSNRARQYNLGLLMRALYGVGTPRALQGRAAALLATLWSLIRHLETPAAAIRTRLWLSTARADLRPAGHARGSRLVLGKALATAC